MGEYISDGKIYAARYWMKIGDACNAYGKGWDPEDGWCSMDEGVVVLGRRPETDPAGERGEASPERDRAFVTLMWNEHYKEGNWGPTLNEGQPGDGPMFLRAACAYAMNAASNVDMRAVWRGEHSWMRSDMVGKPADHLRVRRITARVSNQAKHGREVVHEIGFVYYDGTHHKWDDGRGTRVSN